MLSFETCSLASDAAAAKKNRPAQTALANQRFDAVTALAAAAPDARQSIYQMVADRLPDMANVASLPPFGKAVFAARWIRDRKFDQALAAAESLERDTGEKQEFLTQDAIFFKAVCLQELKQPVPAAQAYLRFARDFPKDSRAPQSLLPGLSLLAKQDDVLEDAASRALLTDVGDMLTRSTAPEVEKYKQAWLPLVAEANLREARYDRAAELFQMVPKDSKAYGAAVVGRILAISGKLRFTTAAKDKEKARSRGRRRHQRGGRSWPGSWKPNPLAAATTQPQAPNILAARLQLEAARLSLDTLGDADRALQLLEGAETRWQQNPALLAQLLNVRIQAYQKAGKPDQATSLVDQFMAARPDAAGPLLASLLGDMQREIEQQQKLGRTEQADRYTTLAMSLAEQLDKWAAAHPGAIKGDQQYAIRYRLARALLQAGQADRALAVFEDLYKQDAERSGGQAKDAAVLEGRAVCLFQPGEVARGPPGVPGHLAPRPAPHPDLVAGDPAVAPVLGPDQRRGPQQDPEGHSPAQGPLLRTWAAWSSSSTTCPSRCSSGSMPPRRPSRRRSRTAVASSQLAERVCQRWYHANLRSCGHVSRGCRAGR